MYVHGDILVRHHGYLKPEDICDLPLEPFQPKHIAFPCRSFGKSAAVNRSFQATWFTNLGAALRRYAGRRLLLYVLKKNPDIIWLQIQSQSMQISKFSGQTPLDKYRIDTWLEGFNLLKHQWEQRKC